MVLSGFTDEAADTLKGQIAVCRELGWTGIDLRTVDGSNIVDIPEARFDDLVDELSLAGIRVVSFGSRIANWSRTLEDPFDQDLDDLERAIPRMRRLGVPYLRVMSYRPPETAEEAESPRVSQEIIRRLRLLAARAENAGIVLTHENCETWGGRSYEHTLQLLEGIDSPAFKLVFDTGNPPATIDHRDDAAPGTRQDALEFYRQVRQAVVHVHIKDARLDDNNVVYTWPGEGSGRIPEILTELRENGYDGPFSIEPHMAVVYHDPSVQAEEDARRRVYVEYARRTEVLLDRTGFLIGTQPVRYAPEKP